MHIMVRKIQLMSKDRWKKNKINYQNMTTPIYAHITHSYEGLAYTLRTNTHACRLAVLISDRPTHPNKLGTTIYSIMIDASS